ncbi:MAG TPA: PIN domain-containing protein [Polyangiaceae bacterium]
MILTDTGPLVALFDPRDDDHRATEKLLATFKNPLITTTPVLTEAFHLLDPASRAAEALREFIDARGIGVWFMDQSSLGRALELMQKYADHPMDFADASLVTAAEVLRTTSVFTLDRGDFATYRPKIGRTPKRFRVFDPARA